jgi:hypothetical protein
LTRDIATARRHLPMEELMKESMGAMVVLLLASTLSGHTQESKAPPDLGGKYRCEPQPRECQLGKTFVVTQSGTRLEMENEKGERIHAQRTSDITITMGPPWNNLGVIYGNSIQWSNGTKWAKAD